MLWGGILFHLGIYATIEVGWFSFYTIAMYGVWIPDAWWKRYFGPRERRGASNVDGATSVGAATTDAAAVAVGPDDYRVYYDTLCPVCRRSRATLERLDFGGRLVFRDIHDRPTMEREAPGVPYVRAMKEMIVLSPRGRVAGGFDAFRTLAWTLPPLWPLVPLLYVPGVPWIGRRAYRAIARNRYRLVACDDGICSLHLRALSKEILDEAEIRRIVAQAKAEAKAHGL
jgi:predicted DCC family thiol-disulfide oxidoreductase YuxK